MEDVPETERIETARQVADQIIPRLRDIWRSGGVAERSDCRLTIRLRVAILGAQFLFILKDDLISSLSVS